MPAAICRSKKRAKRSRYGGGDTQDQVPGRPREVGAVLGEASASSWLTAAPEEVSAHDGETGSGNGNKDGGRKDVDSRWRVGASCRTPHLSTALNLQFFSVNG